MNLSQQIEHWLNGEVERFGAADRPFVTLSFAQGWDGSIALQSGASLALSCEESLNLTHHLRSLHDGILVGIGTVLADDPRLTVRKSSGPSPQPIVLDSQLRIPDTARLCRPEGQRCWVLSRCDGSNRADGNFDIIALPPDQDGRVCLQQALQELRRRNITRLMVEGGANVITAFLRHQLVDALVLTVAPTLVGGYKAVQDLGYTMKSQLPRINPMHTRQLGEDLILWGNLQYGEPSQ